MLRTITCESRPDASSTRRSVHREARRGGALSTTTTTNRQQAEAEEAGDHDGGIVAAAAAAAGLLDRCGGAHVAGEVDGDDLDVGVVDEFLGDAIDERQPSGRGQDLQTCDLVGVDGAVEAEGG
jgi:hypothetical protein